MVTEEMISLVVEKGMVCISDTLTLVEIYLSIYLFTFLFIFLPVSLEVI